MILAEKIRFPIKTQQAKFDLVLRLAHNIFVRVTRVFANRLVFSLRERGS